MLGEWGVGVCYCSNVSFMTDSITGGRRLIDRVGGRCVEKVGGKFGETSCWCGVGSGGWVEEIEVGSGRVNSCMVRALMMTGEAHEQS